MTENLTHPSDPPEFKFDSGQPFKLAGDDDPEEFWYVLERVWNYDVEVDSYGPPGWYFKQYLIGEVSTLGGNPRLISEKDLLEHYEPVTKEAAQEVL
ncbi:hypothetical protein [Halocatena halophila]|uniref:hypothetical protein n=1 Tax=Halocatena halophila TaxID=2814576 RepID=UPI002ED1B691